MADEGEVVVSENIDRPAVGVVVAGDGGSIVSRLNARTRP
jgi:hypothetical protein